MYNNQWLESHRLPFHCTPQEGQEGVVLSNCEFDKGRSFFLNEESKTSLQFHRSNTTWKAAESVWAVGNRQGKCWYDTNTATCEKLLTSSNSLARLAQASYALSAQIRPLVTPKAC